MTVNLAVRDHGGDGPWEWEAVPIFGQVTSPFLIVLATKNLPGMPPDLVELMDAHRTGLRRDLATLMAHRHNIRVHELDASHAMVAERPDELAVLINRFVGEHQ